MLLLTLLPGRPIGLRFDTIRCPRPIQQMGRAGHDQLADRCAHDVLQLRANLALLSRQLQHQPLVHLQIALNFGGPQLLPPVQTREYYEHADTNRNGD